LSTSTQARLRAAITAVAPAVLLLGFAYHPYVANATNEAALARATASDTTRWGLAHLTIGVGYALLALSFIALRSFLREAGENRWSAKALPFAVFGCALFPILVGMEFAPLAAAETGGDVEAVHSELAPWFIPVLVPAAICFTLGAVGCAIGITRSGVLGKRLARLVAGALVVMAAARFVPLGAAQVVIGVAGVVAFWPLALAMWNTSTERQSAPVNEGAATRDRR
jgi:FtsH-binding integral membrane protein